MAVKRVRVAGFLVIGSSVVDIIARTTDVERVDIQGKHVERLVCISFASKSELAGIEMMPGGSGANSAVAFSSLGSSVSLLSAVGRDKFGELVIESLKKRGIDIGSVRVFSGVPTGLSIVLLSGAGEKSILTYRGANSSLGPADIVEADVRNSSRIFIASLVSDSNYRLFEKLVALAKKHRRPVIFAPSITMLHAWLPKIRRMPAFDMVIVNYEEGCYYTGKTEIRDVLAALPGKVAVVMKDSDGAYAAEKGKGAFHVNAVPVKIRDTTGAGDAFSGAFAHSYYNGNSVQESLKAAAAVAALKLTREGAQFGFSRPVLDAFVRKHRSSLAVRRI